MADDTKVALTELGVITTWSLALRAPDASVDELIKVLREDLSFLESLRRPSLRAAVTPRPAAKAPAAKLPAAKAPAAKVGAVRTPAAKLPAKKAPAVKSTRSRTTDA